MPNEPEVEVKLTGVTFDRVLETLKVTWHVIALLVLLVWQVAAYKSSNDAQMDLLKKDIETLKTHNISVDQKLDWLIIHNPSAYSQIPADPLTRQRLRRPAAHIPDAPKLAAEKPPEGDAMIPPLAMRF